MMTTNSEGSLVGRLVTTAYNAVRASEASRMVRDMFLPEKHRDTGALILMHLNKLSADLYEEVGKLFSQLEK